MNNKDLYNALILYIGDVEQDKSYFPIDEVRLDQFSPKEIHDYLCMMIEGEIIQGIFADDGVSDQYGYLIGGLNTSSRYYYHQLKKQKSHN